MELALAALLALAVIAAVLAQAGRKIERARVHRLEDELDSLRKASSGARLLDDAAEAVTGDEYAGSPAAQAEQTAAAERVQEQVDAARRLVARAAEELRARRGTPAEAFAAALDDRRRELRALLARVERAEAALFTLLAAGTAIAERHRGENGTRPAADADVPAPAGPEALAAVGESAEAVTDEGFRLNESLGGVARASARLADASHGIAVALAGVERSSEALLPFSQGLSALANRINLLALNTAVRTGSAGAGPLEEAGGELRALVEEGRRLGRELASASQRAADASRAARELAVDAAAVAVDGVGHAERSGRELARLQEMAERLHGALETAKGTLRASEEAHRGCAARREAEAARETARASEAAALGDELARWLSELRGASSLLSELRLAGEQALGALAEGALPAETHAPPELDLALERLSALAAGTLAP